MGHLPSLLIDRTDHPFMQNMAQVQKTTLISRRNSQENGECDLYKLPTFVFVLFISVILENALAVLWSERILKVTCKNTFMDQNRQTPF